MRIMGPNNEVIHTGERETSGKYTFTAHASGTYTYCFSNKMSTMTPKVVMFNMAVGESPKAEAAQEGENTNKLEDMIRELSGKPPLLVLLKKIDSSVNCQKLDFLIFFRKK